MNQKQFSIHALRGTDGDCAWNDDWVAYKCRGINHRLMIIESMDRDTKIRRLAPIAMLANPGANGFIDLVNGMSLLCHNVHGLVSQMLQGSPVLARLCVSMCF